MDAMDEDPNVLDSTPVEMMDAMDEDPNAILSMQDDLIEVIYEPRINTVRVQSPDMFPQLDPSYQSDSESTPSPQSVSIPCAQMNSTSSFDSQLSLGPAHQTLFPPSQNEQNSFNSLHDLLMPSFNSNAIFHSTALNSEPLFPEQFNNPVQTSKQILSELNNMLSDSSHNTVILPTPSIIPPTSSPPTANHLNPQQKITSPLSLQHSLNLPTLPPHQPSIIEVLKTPPPPPELIDLSTQVFRETQPSASAQPCEPANQTITLDQTMAPPPPPAPARQYERPASPTPILVDLCQESIVSYIRYPLCFPLYN